MPNEDGPPDSPVMDGTIHDDDPTPVPARAESPHREKVIALQNLSISCNVTSNRLATLAHAILRRGLAPEMQRAIGKELRVLGDEFRDTAQMVDPQPPPIPLVATAGR